MADLLFAIPAFNEEATIGRVVRTLSAFGEVLVVDDGSRDDTARAAGAAGAAVHRHAANAGYDAALRTCLDEGRKSSCDWVLTIDADGQHDAGDVDRFRPHFADHDLIVGRRPRRSMRIGERLLGLHYRRLHGIHDPLSGFKGYRRELLRRVALPAAGGPPSYGLDALDAVLLASPRVTEVPISIREREDDARVGDRWTVNKRMFRCLRERMIR